MPDLAEIAERSGIAVRKLRYVLDQALLPGGNVASRGRGTARSFTPFEAFGIATAAVMLEAGLKRSLIRDCLALLCQGPSRNLDRVLLYRAFTADLAARLEIGDWEFVRLVGAGVSPGKSFDTGWLPLAKGAVPAEKYTPLVTVALDVGQIRRRVGMHN